MPNEKREEFSPVKLKCRQCVYKTKNRSDLRRHERRHKDVKFPCDICNMPFMTAGHLGGHKRSAHNVPTERATSKPVFRQYCHQCDYTTMYSSDMSKHRRKHEVNQHPCPICNYPFGHITTLTIHIRKYHGKDETVDLTEGPKTDYSDASNKNKVKDFKSVQTDLKENIQFYRRSGNKTKIPDKRESRQVRSTTAKELVERKSINSVGKCNSYSLIAHKGDAGETLHGKDTSTSENKANTVTEYNSTLPNCIKVKTKNLQKPNPTQMQSSLPKKDMCKRKKTYACKDCAFNTRDEETFGRHNKRHEKGKFKCEKCGMPFLFRTNLDKHLDTKHVDQSDSSDSSFDTLTVNSPTVLKCAKCKFATFSYNQLESHANQHERLTKTDEKRKRDLKMDFENDVFLYQTNAGHEKSLERVDEVKRDSECKVKKQDIINMSDIDLNDKTKPLATNEELIKCTEEFHCRECNYVTSDKKFIKLHMTMHGSDYMAPKNGRNRKRSISAKVLGYETRIKWLDNALALTAKEIDSRPSHCNTKVDYKRSVEKSLYVNLVNGTYTPSDEEANTVNLVKDCERDNLNKIGSEINKQNVVQTELLTKSGTGNNISSRSHDTNLIDLIGGLTKEDFKRTKKFYTSEQINDKVLYCCKLCVAEGQFNAQDELYDHFKSQHRELKERICASCKYCNGPFPAIH